MAATQEAGQRQHMADQLRGIALWLIVAYHETKDSPFAEQQELHRQAMRALRALKEAVPAGDLNHWMLIEAEAA